MTAPMNVGANLWIWESPVTQRTIEREAPRLASWGFDSIELPLETAGDWDPAAIEHLLRETGLAASVCVAMSPGRDLTTADTVVVRNTVDYLLAAIEAAARIGAPVVAGPVYSPTGHPSFLTNETRQEMLLRLAENLTPVLEHARAANIGIAVEPLNRFETSLFNTTGQVMSFIHQLDHPNLGVLLDTFHMNIEEADIVSAFCSAGSRLMHVHACGNDRGTPRIGTIPWPEIIAALHAIGYTGQLVIESFTAGNRALATAASIWRPLAVSPDALACDGLAMLRSMLATHAQPSSG
jgi:D-psicose/D-tagatose/L-ribulose 3-epimerase